MPFGCSVGIAPWSYSINKIGPKNTMVLQTPFYILTCVIMITIRTIETYITARFFSGFLMVSYYMGAEKLLMDTIHHGYLDYMLVLFNSSVPLGILISYIVGNYSIIWLGVMCAVIPLVNMLLLSLLPESPVFLYDRSERKAEISLGWYRGKANIKTALQSIRKDSDVRKMGTETFKYMFYSKVVLKGFFIAEGVNFFRVFSGYYVFIFYNLLVWRNLPSVFNSFTDAMIFGSCLYISNLIGNIVHSRKTLGVQKPLLISCTLVAIALTIITLDIFLIEEHFTEYNKRRLNWIHFAALNFFVVSYEIGLGTYPDILLYEYLPYQVYPTVRMISRTLYWFQIFLVTKYFITIRHFVTHYLAFGILTIISYLSILYCYYFIIEYKGKNLLQVQIEIGGNPVGNRGAYRSHIRPTRQILI